MKRVLIDTDIGRDVDDALAVVLATRLPELRLEGISTVYGDVDLRAKIALKLLQLLGMDRDIPVTCGVGCPLIAPVDYTLSANEGKGILTEADRTLVPSQEHAVDFIIRKVHEYPKQVTLIAIGALTNIAIALRKAPTIAQQVREVIFAGGSARLWNNAPDMPASYVLEPNVRCDPEAAHIVFESGMPITMLGMDVTTQVALNREDLTTIRASKSTLSTTLGDMIEVFWKFSRETWGWSGDESLMFDPLAVAVAAQPDLIQTVECQVTVEVSGRCSTGLTLVVPKTMWHSKWQKRGAAIRKKTGVSATENNGIIKVARSVNAKKFHELLIGGLCQQ